MKKEAVAQLLLFKTKDKFPVDDWDKRGLVPSPGEVRDKMNEEVNRFIDFVLSKPDEHTNAMTNEIQQYMDEWDKFGFDTEETYYIADILCEVMAMIEVNVNDIRI